MDPQKVTESTHEGPTGTAAVVARARDAWQQLSATAQDRLVGVALFVPAATVLAIARVLVADPLGHGTHQQLGLGACTVLTLTGWPCPMCGMTTCFTHMAHLSPVEATLVQPFGVVLFSVTVVLAVVGGLDLVWPRQRWRRLLAFALRHEGALAGGLLGGMALGWIYKVLEMGLI